MSKKKYYLDPNQNLDFPKMEEQILHYWQEQKIFEKSIAIRDFSSTHDDDQTST